MAKTLSGSIGLALNAKLQDAGTRGSQVASTNPNYTDALTNGTGAGQCNRHYSAQLSIGPASSVTIDLMALVDTLGDALTLVKVKHIVLRPLVTNANKVVMGAAAATPFLGPLLGTTPTMDLEPGDSYKLSKSAAGWTVAGSNKDLKFANAGAGTCLVDIDIFGTDA